jgi:2-dehydropantoate 2-reductase
MRIAIVGAGGVGGYFGARLAASDCEIVFVARGAHLEAMRRQGLRVVSALGDLTLKSVNAVDEIAKVGAVDLVAVAVKLWDTEEVAARLRPLTDQGATVVSFQNGVHKDDALRRHVPSAQMLGGLCYLAAAVSEPGVIRHTGTMQRLVFGEYGGLETRRVRALFDACQRAGIEATISDAIERATWEKFVFVVGLSAVTACIRKPIGPIRENPRTRALLLEVMREVVAVGRARGIAFRESYPEEVLAFCDTLPPATTSSMHNDLELGHRLELPWLSGAVADMGALLKVATPFNRTISDVLSLHAQGAR